MKNKVLFVVVALSLIIIFVLDFSKVFNYFGDIYTNNKLQKVIIRDVINIDFEESTNKEIFNVNFDKLLNMNKDTVAWVKFNNDKVNYPVVKALDNDYYLNRSFDGKTNQTGTVFMDYRNNSINDRNVILYGHSMLDGSMFGSMRDVFNNKNFFKNKDNNYIKIYTKDEGELIYQIFSYYIIEAEEYYITTDFTDETFQEFINTIKNRSEKDLQVPVDINDKILTLSTCSGTGGTKMRKVIHAKRVISSDEVQI